MKSRFRVKVSDHSDADHWCGGESCHEGARCPTCDIPLLLLWDINCRDPRFPSRTFGPLDRLPLYYCWGCVSDISYQLVDQARIVVHSQSQRAEPSFPYDPYPTCFERRGLQLFEGIPDAILRIFHELNARWDTAVGSGPVPEPSQEDQQELIEFFGHPVIMPRCFVHHQLGGEPMMDGWAQEVFDCPNPQCTGSANRWGWKRKSRMKFLAGILNDPCAGLPMVDPPNESVQTFWNYEVSVQYHVCDLCWTVLGCNRCS